MKPFRNKGWRWLRYMEKILPIAGATGAHSYAPTQARPPPLVDQDDDADLEQHSLMDIDGLPSSQPATAISSASASTAPASASTSPASASTHISSANISQPLLSSQARVSQQLTTIPAENVLELPPTKRLRLQRDISASSSSLSVPTDSSRISGKGKTKARTSSDNISSRALSTSQRVSKVTPAVALIELHGSINNMTQAIRDVSKESTDDKALVQRAMQLVDERDDGLSLSEKAALIVFFGSHHREVDMYLGLQNDELRQAVIRQWLQVGNS